MTGHIAPGGIAPVVPVLSMFDPVHIGADEFGASVHMKVIYKNLLAAGEPGGGKSALLKPCSPRTPPCPPRSRLVLFDGKLVELGLYKKVADEFVGPDIGHAIITLRRLQAVHEQPVRLAGRPAAPQDRTLRRPDHHHLDLR